MGDVKWRKPKHRHVNVGSNKLKEWKINIGVKQCAWCTHTLPFLILEG